MYHSVRPKARQRRSLGSYGTTFAESNVGFNISPVRLKGRIKPGSTAMIFFDYQGRDPKRKNRVRKLFMSSLIIIAGILLYPFTLLALLFLGMWQSFSRWAPPH
jgi:hypothetical protein